MKKVFFVRHAKSSWDDLNIFDFERGLNARGRRDAPAMAKYLKSQGVKFDAILTSSAVRARTTAAVFKEYLGVSDANYYLSNELYHSSQMTLLTSLHSLIDDYECVAIFAHNPGMTWLANSFSSERIDNVPTCGIFSIVFDVSKWIDIAIDSSNGTWKQMWTPKSII